MNIAKLGDELATNMDGQGSDASATRNFVPSGRRRNGRSGKG
jgi:hypothetical protein